MRFFRSYMLEVATKKTDVILSAKIFGQALGLSMEAWPNSVGAFASKIREFETIRNFLASASLISLVDIPFAILFLLLIAYIGGAIVFVPLTIIALIICTSLILVKPIRDSVRATSESFANKQALLIENLHEILTVKTSGATANSQWEWEEATGDIANKSLKSNMLIGVVGTLTVFLTNLATVLIILFGVYAIKNLELTLGGLIAVVILSARSIAPLSQLASLIVNYEQAKSAFLNLDELMKAPIDRPENHNFVTPPKFTGDLALKNISFHYPNSAIKALDTINLSIKSGERVAIIGKSGSGKTSLAHLLAGLYKPVEGDVLVDSVDLKQIDPADTRKHVGYMPQETGLFRGTIRENILFGMPNLQNDEAVKRAATLAGVDLFIDRYPSSYDMEVAEQGLSLIHI